MAEPEGSPAMYGNLQPEEVEVIAPVVREVQAHLALEQECPVRSQPEEMRDICDCNCPVTKCFWPDWEALSDLILAIQAVPC